MEFKQNTLINQIEEETKTAEMQRALHEKHHIEDENVMIVEKPSFLKFVLKTFISFGRLILNIIFVCLAAIGIIGLLYTEPREMIIEIIVNGFSNL